MLGYSTLIAGVHRNNYQAIRALLVDAMVRDDRMSKNPAIGWVHPWVPFGNAVVVASVVAIEAKSSNPCALDLITNLINGSQGRLYTPGSDLLHKILREPLRPMILDDDDYTETFDRSEVLLALMTADAVDHTVEDIPSPYYGAFTCVIASPTSSRHHSKRGSLMKLAVRGARGRRCTPDSSGETRPVFELPLKPSSVERKRHAHNATR